MSSIICTKRWFCLFLLYYKAPAPTAGKDNKNKRNVDDRDLFSCNEEDEVVSMLKKLPESVQKRCAALPVAQRAPWLNTHLNSVVSDLPELQQQAVRSKSSNQEKFSKLLECVKARKNAKLKQGADDEQMSDY